MPSTTGQAGNTVSCYYTTNSNTKSQVVGFGQPKDLYSFASRLAITSPDVAGSYAPTSISPTGTLDSASLWVGGDCNTASATLSFVVALYDATGQLMQVSQAYTLSTGATFVKSGRYQVVGTPAVVDLVGAASYAIIVTSVSTGSWSLYSRLF